MGALFWFLACLVITIVVEGIVIAIKYRRKDCVYYSLLCNILTNPLLNLILIFFVDTPLYILAVIVLEIIVVFVEAYVYRILCKFPQREAIRLSLLLNASSYLIGFLVTRGIILI